ncbi:hypothetical protein [Nocardia sp. bgisy118]|uniref:hypothetical protein n=1 Tax=Nocardia sp. bgisy118 TaxID=3413786 RepID=UPI003F49C747
MPLIGEMAGSLWASDTNDRFIRTVDLEMPPTPTFAKVYLQGSWQSEEYGSIRAQILNYRRRLPDNSDEVISFRAPDRGEWASIVFDVTMTHVTFAIQVSFSGGQILWTMGFWS